jgi:hypothetical protein
MKKPSQPHDVAKFFFQSLMQNQCHVCWGLFSDKTQREFINWTLKDIYAQNPKAAKAAKLGTPEVKLMFETNNLDLIIRFWRRFVRQSRAVEFARYAYFDTLENRGKSAIVEARMIYENGQEQRVQLTMLQERGGWRLGYLESGMGF